VPEIWLPYGQVEVVINAKAENLGDVVEAPPHVLGDQAVLEQIKGLPRKGFVLLDGSNSSVDVLNLVASVWQAPPKEVTVSGRGPWSPGVLKRLERFGYSVSVEAPEAELGVVDGVLVRSLAKLRPDDSLVISEGAFDPVFGFRGAPVAVTRALGLGVEAVRRWKGEPASGKDTDPGWFAGRVASEVGDVLSLEYVRGRKGLAALNLGSCSEAHSRSAKFLGDNDMFTISKSRFFMVSPGGGEGDPTLHSALLALLNQMEALGEDAEAVLIAEALEGLGSAALRSLCDMDVRQESLSHVEGYEDVLMLKWIKANLKLHMVSTLPRTIVEKRLGLIGHQSAKQAFEEVESRHGGKLKATVVKDASITALKTA
jgi:hypothetical protein